MSDRIDDLPRDLRALCGGTVVEADGSRRMLVFPADSYAKLCEVREELELAIDDPCNSIEDIESLREELELVEGLQVEMKERILNDFNTPRPASEPKVDRGAESKMKKAIADAEAGRYERQKKTKTLRALLKALDFYKKNGRMPSHDELKKLGFNDQQATDAGKWLEMQADPNPDDDSLFLPLHRPKRGRPRKK